MPSNTRGSQADEIVAKCTAVAGGNTTLTPVNANLFFASTIVINGNVAFKVGQDYIVSVKRKA